MRGTAASALPEPFDADSHTRTGLAPYPLQPVRTEPNVHPHGELIGFTARVEALEAPHLLHVPPKAGDQCFTSDLQLDRDQEVVVRPARSCVRSCDESRDPEHQVAVAQSFGRTICRRCQQHAGSSRRNQWMARHKKRGSGHKLPCAGSGYPVVFPSPWLRQQKARGQVPARFPIESHATCPALALTAACADKTSAAQ